MAPTVPIEFAGQKESKRCSVSPMMGKSRKYSKGHSSGFFPDYRHAAETMAESEGFGSSGRVDTEMTASEDSCTPKRKSISLNVDNYDSFGAPLQVLSLSKMSRTERKDLEVRLKRELEQVRILQRKVASLSSNVVLSPTSDIRSCSDGLKRPPLENFHMPSGVSAPKGKKKAPPGRNVPQTKRSNSGRSESVKTGGPGNTSNAMLMKQCESLLNRLMSHQYGWVFNTPVDVVKLNIPDYFTVIKHPMDLGTVKRKIASGQYSSVTGFAADVRLTFSNAMTYNPPGNDVHVMAETLSKLFEGRWKAIEKKLPLASEAPSVPSRASGPTESETTTGMPPVKKTKVASVDNKIKAEPVRQVMTNEDKRILSTELEGLLEELPENIVEFLKEHSFSAGQTSEDDELEIDIDALSDDTLFALRKLLDDYLLQKQKNQAKPGPCEMEIVNESRFSNSSALLSKGNGLVDEDVNIVDGNDLPPSNIPEEEVAKDAARETSKCGSSSSSSSESDSSSSDSDSGNSSGNEADAAKASVPATAEKENLSSEANVDKSRNDLSGQENGNSHTNGLDQDELNNQAKPIAEQVEGHQEEGHEEGHQEGESAPSERQVSPDKLYRAALLRNRFADTILKAREKALEKGEKRDPEKLRIEREELERRQREEKARLQAEAKAAEEARRKAEAEAAAEAKRKREQEREAARQALLMMEKTVDINENSQFMEDLEMLRSTQDENLESFIEETRSPEHSLSRLGSIKLQGSSNPLEQLGLYMKDDDVDVDEEEESEPPPKPLPEPVKDKDVEPVKDKDVEPVKDKDVEEGEID